MWHGWRLGIPGGLNLLLLMSRSPMDVGREVHIGLSSLMLQISWVASLTLLLKSSRSSLALHEADVRSRCRSLGMEKLLLNRYHRGLEAKVVVISCTPGTLFLRLANMAMPQW